MENRRRDRRHLYGRRAPHCERRSGAEQGHCKLRIMTIVNIAAYKFLPLTDLRPRRSRLQSLCRQASLKGTILLSHEGINLFVAGEAAGIEQLLGELRSWPGLEDLQPKRSENDHQP